MGRLLTVAGLMAAALALLGCGSVDRGIPTDSSTTSATSEAGAAAECRPEPDQTSERHERVANGELGAREAMFDEAVEIRGCMIEHGSGEVKEQLCEVEDPTGGGLPPRMAREQAKMLDALKEKAGC
jgi:hypothetical protein